MKLVIIGGGPAGMMAAISAKINHPNTHVVILEKNQQLGRKLLLTGGGRCNLCANVSVEKVIENTPKNGKFLYSSLMNFGPKDIMDFFGKLGIDLVVEKDMKVYPKSGKALDVLMVLIDQLVKLKVVVKYGFDVKDINFNQKEVLSFDGAISYDYLIIATGGITYPATGSNGAGYKLAKKANHFIENPLLAEVPLVCNDTIIQTKQLQGLSFSNVNIAVLKNEKIYHQVSGDLIFTHFGISGPAALKASFYVNELRQKQDKVEIIIDFFPDLAADDICDEKLPKRLKQFLTNSKNDLSYLKAMPLIIVDTKGKNDAFVTNGGINVKEIDPQTMRSKINEHLSFAGEIIDVCAHTGGFNLTMCFSTGFVAGKYFKR